MALLRGPVGHPTRRGLLNPRTPAAAVEAGGVFGHRHSMACASYESFSNWGNPLHSMLFPGKQKDTE